MASEESAVPIIDCFVLEGVAVDYPIQKPEGE